MGLAVDHREEEDGPGPPIKDGGQTLTLSNSEELKDHELAAWWNMEGRGDHAASNWFHFLEHCLLPVSP